LDDNKSIVCFSKYKEMEDFDATASSSLCNTAGNTDSGKHNLAAIATKEFM